MSATGTLTACESGFFLRASIAVTRSGKQAWLFTRRHLAVQFAARRGIRLEER